MRLTIRRLGRVLGLAAVIVMLSAPAGLVQAALVWQTETVDSEGVVGASNSLALDSNGLPHISYVDYIDPNTGNLKYAYYTGTAWQTETVDSVGSVGAYSSLELDGDGLPHISYFDDINRMLKYAHYTGTSWQIETVESEGIVVPFTSLALDASGLPHISFHDGADSTLKYAHYTGTDWQIETVDSTEGFGAYSSLELDGNDQPHISYYDAINGDLKYAVLTDAGWQTETVDSEGDAGATSSIAIDGGGLPHIIYLDYANAGLRYAYSTGADWQTETLDSLGSVGEFSSLALDMSGSPHISYNDKFTDTTNYAVRSGSGWQTWTVDSTGILGRFSSLALDSNDQPHISYHDGINLDLKYASGQLVNEPPTVVAGGPYTGDEGSPISLQASVSDPDEDALTTTWSYTIDSSDAGASCTFGDASQVETTFTCTDDGSFTVTLQADDGSNPPVSGTATVTIGNVASTVSLGDDVEINEGDSFSTTGSFSDAGSNDTHSATVDYGDGSGAQPLPLDSDGGFTLNHTYLDDGPYSVEVCVTDDEQGVGCDTVQVIVLNVAPTITDISIEVSSPRATVTVIANDPAGVNDPLSYAFDCDNDGSYEVDAGETNSTTCLLGDNEGSFTVGVQVSDDDGGTATDTATVTIATYLCANDYTGVLRYSDTCHAHETTVTIPDPNGPVTVCASTHNGLLRAPASGICAGHETTYELPEDGPLNVCVSTYTQTIRVVDGLGQCSMHEFGWVIAATEVGEPPPPRIR